MVAPTYAQPVFAFDNIQDAFNLVSQGFEAYQDAATKYNSCRGPSERPAKKQKSYQPDVDILETPTDVVVEIALPGVAKEAINVEYDSESNRIILTGESKRTEAENTKSIRHERPVGKFERVVGLNKQIIHPDRISAAHENGILTLTIPKNTEAETKLKINIL